MTFVRTHGLFGRIAALVLAFALVLPSASAFSLPAEPAMKVSVQYTDAQGMTVLVAATPLTYPGYENAFWVNVPADALAAAPLLFVEDVFGQYAAITPGFGTALSGVLDAGSGLTNAVPVEILCYDANQTVVATYYLYLSTTTILPDMPAVTPKTMQLTIHYVNDQYLPVASDETQTLSEGANQPIYANPQNLQPDYTLTGEGVQYVTVDQSSPEQSEIFFIYTYTPPAPKTMQLTIHYVNDQYVPVANDDTQTLSEGANQPIYANPQNLQPDYTLTGEGVQYVTVDQSSPEQSEIFFIYAYTPPAPKTMQLTIHYVNDQYVPVANDETQTLSEGANQPIYANPQNLQPDYTLTGEGVQYVTVDQSSPEQSEIFFIYTYTPPAPKTMQLTIHYVNDQYVPVASDETQTLSEGANQPIYANPQNLQPDYTLTGEGVQYVTVDQSSPEQSEIFFVYAYTPPAPKTVQVNVYYVDAAYAPVAESDTLTVSEGRDIPVAADPQNLAANYELDGQPVKYINIDRDSPDTMDVYFIYRYVEPVVVPKHVTLTVHYVNQDNVPVALDDVTELSEGTDIPVYANPKDLLPNYELDGSNVQYITIDQYSADTYEITFRYKPIAQTTKEVTLTVHYVNSEFVPVADDDVMRLGIGDNQPVTADPKNLLPDYSLASDRTQYVSVSEQSDDTYEIFFIYEYSAPVTDIKTMELTVHYVDSEMLPVADDQTFTLNEGANQPITANPTNLMANYYLTGDAVRYVDVNRSSPMKDELYFYYEYREPVAEAKKMTLTIHYVNFEQMPVAADDVITLTEGDDLPITAAPRNLLENYVLYGNATQYVTVNRDSAPTGEIFFYYQYLAPSAEPIVTETPPPAPKVALITVQYKTLDGQVLYVETAVPCFEGQANVIRYDASKLGYGYILSDDAEKSVSVDANGVASPSEIVFYVSEPDEVFINIYYRSIDGLDVASSQTELCAIGNNSFSANPINLLPGYSLVGEESQSVYLDEAGNLSVGEIVFWYQPIVTATPYNATATPIPYVVVPMDTYCYPKNDGLNFRSSPSNQIDSNIIRTLLKNELSHIVGLVVNELNEEWYLVDIQGVRGFLKGNFVRILSDAEIAALLGITPPTPSASPTAAATPIPDGAPIDRWGTINDKSVRFRRAPQTGNNIITSLAKNTRTWVYQSTTAEDGVKWYFVNVNGKQGYIMAQFITLMTEEQNTAYQASLPSPVPTQTPLVTVPPVPPVTETPPVPTATATPDFPVVTPTATPEIYHGYALTTSQAFLRTGVSLTDDSILAILPERTLVNITAQTYIDGVCWDSADVIGINMRGFLEDSTLRHINNEEAAYYINNLSPAVPTSTPTPTPTQYDGYAITQGDNVPVRAFPDTNAKIEEILQIGSVVMVHGQEYIGGTAWHVVQSGSMWGYIRGDQLRMLSEWEVTGYLESLKTPTPTPSVTQTPTVSENNLSSYGYVDTNKVNLRAAPSKSAAKIRMLDEYAFALVSGTVTNEEGTWYQVSQAGTEGYIMSDYFTVLTLGELTEFLQSDNYLNSSSDATVSTGSQIQAVEDYNQTVWNNPNLNASYEPFNPYATPTPNPEIVVTPSPSPSPSPTPFSTFALIGGVTTPAPTAPTSSFPYGLVLLAVVLIGGSGAVYAYTIHRRNERRRQAVRAQQSRQANMAGQQPYMRTAQNNPPAQQTRAYPAAPYMPPMGGTPRAAQPPQTPQTPQTTSQYQPIRVPSPYQQPLNQANAPRNTAAAPQTTGAYVPVGRTPSASAQTTNPYRPVRAQMPQTQATRQYAPHQAEDKPAEPAQATVVYPAIKPSDAAQSSSITVDQPIRRRRSDRHQHGDGNA